MIFDSRIALLGCSKLKAAMPCAAREMYAASPLFRATLQWASEYCDRAYILSALHGVVELDAVIEPYDLQLSALSPADRQAWGTRVGQQLDQLIPWPDESDALVIPLASRLYVDSIDLPDDREIFWHEPLKGLGIGSRLHALKTGGRALGVPA